MKRLSVFCFAMLLCLGMLAGCASEESPISSGINSSEAIQLASEPQQSAEESEGTSEETSTEFGDTSTGMPIVYMTTGISAEGLIAIYNALNASPSGNIAVKLSTEESGSSMWGGDQDAFLGSMAEAGKFVVDYLDGNILYINIMNRLSVDCDCDGNSAEPDMHDIGILVSFDPVAVDQVCIDLVYAAEDGDSLVQRIESRNGLHTLEHAEAIGLGSRTYELVSIDG